MNSFQKQQDKLPMLLFMLEHKKHSELIKSMLNQNLSRKLLEQYGAQKQQFSKIESFKIKQDSQHFTIQDLIQIKGSNDNKVKRFQNIFLIETILKKLKSNYHVEPQQRKLFWIQFTQIYAHQELYQNLAALELPPDTEQLLDKDINRTHYNLPTRNQIEKSTLQTILRKSIKQSLSRFSLYNPYILYCQGMHQIFAFFHQQNFNPKITQVLLPTDYYISLEGLTYYLKILWDMITVLYPKLHSKLTYLMKIMEFGNNYTALFNFVIQLFVSLFTDSMLNRQIRRTVMDYFLLQGITVFFKASLALFQYLEQTIMKANSFELYVIKIEQAIKKYNDVEHLRKILNSKFISSEILFLLKQSLINQKQQIKRKFIPNSKKCSRKWNFCIQKLQNNKSEQKNYQCFVFKKKQSVKIIPDYLNKLKSYYFDKKKAAKPIDSQRIGRIPHICSHTQQTLTQDSLSENNKKQSPITSRYSPSPSRQLLIEVKSAKNIPQNSNLILNPPSLNEFNQFQATYKQNESKENQISSQSQMAVNDDQSLYHRKQTLQYREIIKQKLLEQTENKKLQKSESMMFMKMMVDNQSYSNLFHMLENQQMDKMFDIDSSDDQSSESPQNNPNYQNTPNYCKKKQI